MSADPKHHERPIETVAVEDLGHPKGTLAIVLIYGALFALGWILLYFVEFIPRGTP